MSAAAPFLVPFHHENCFCSLICSRWLGLREKRYYEIFFIVATWKDLHVFMHVLRHKSVIKLHFCFLGFALSLHSRASLRRARFYERNKKIIMWNYKRRESIEQERCDVTEEEKRRRKKVVGKSFFALNQSWVGEMRGARTEHRRAKSKINSIKYVKDYELTNPKFHIFLSSTWRSARCSRP